MPLNSSNNGTTSTDCIEFTPTGPSPNFNYFDSVGLLSFLTDLRRDG